jgi:hypothetical protein
LREQYRTLDPVALLTEIRAAQEELGNRIDRRAGCALRERLDYANLGTASHSRGEGLKGKNGVAAMKLR